ncbi:hypothetical protein ELI_02230 [Erythrobacter litoralis HTCC2594]|uniref:Uncharacterized protein n=1 Tax=Erythrobacter litoralis (strain HTCC2594) TaxID=314225 RepID=Q2NCQ3_ERYLH|nr:hypothetical protein ELI_02230 [Erythrobacter litoralis HTCC2594]
MLLFAYNLKISREAIWQKICVGTYICISPLFSKGFIASVD